jgi:hypothetical protein
MVEILGTINGSGRLTEDDQPLNAILASAADLDLYFYLDKLRISVSKPSSDGGILEIRDTNGNTKWEMSTDEIKEVDLDFGLGLIFDDDYRLGVDVITHSSENPAHVWVFVEGHYDFRS